MVSVWGSWGSQGGLDGLDGLGCQGGRDCQGGQVVGWSSFGSGWIMVVFSRGLKTLYLPGGTQKSSGQKTRKSLSRHTKKVRNHLSRHTIF